MFLQTGGNICFDVTSVNTCETPVSNSTCLTFVTEPIDVSESCCPILRSLNCHDVHTFNLGTLSCI